MKITDILSPDSIVCQADAGSKKQLLEMLAALAAPRTGLDERLIMDALIERERLGQPESDGGWPCRIPA